METTLKQFGIEPTLLIAQIVNFLILLFLLNKFLYKPILKVLSSRRDRITKSLEDAERISEELEKTKQKSSQHIHVAILESKKIISEANAQAQSIIEDARARAKSDVEKILTQAKSEIESQHQAMKAELRSELADLVVLATQKVTSSLLDRRATQNLTSKVIKDL